MEIGKLLVEGLLQERRFVGLGRAAEGVAEGEDKTAIQIGRSLGEHALRKPARGFDVGRVVHKDERLERRLRALAEEGADLAVGRVEGGERRVVGRAAPEDIHAASVEIAALVLLVGGVDAVPDAGRLVGLHAGPADLRVEQARDGERVVADEFGVEPDARSAGEQPVVGIFLQLRWRHRGRLPIGRARHHQPDQRLHVPRPDGLGIFHSKFFIGHPAIAELHRQPIQQLGMARPFAL